MNIKWLKSTFIDRKIKYDININKKRRRLHLHCAFYTVHFIILSYFNLILLSITHWVSLATVCLYQYWQILKSQPHKRTTSTTTKTNVLLLYSKVALGFLNGTFFFDRFKCYCINGGNCQIKGVMQGNNAEYILYI